MTTELVIHQYAVSDMERMAEAFAKSKLFGVTTPEQALALCLVAQAEGRHPASAANDYHIINGRPSKKAEAMLRDFIAGGGKVEWHTLDDTLADATFSHQSGGTVRIAWDMKRKQQAGINNPQWSKYPRQMLRSRCISEGVRTVFPAATSGMYEPEETREFAAPPKETLRDVNPPKVGKTGKAATALASVRTEEEHDPETGEIANEPPAGRFEDNTDDRFAALLPYEAEFDLEALNDPAAYTRAFNSIMKTNATLRDLPPAEIINIKKLAAQRIAALKSEMVEA